MSELTLNYFHGTPGHFNFTVTDSAGKTTTYGRNLAPGVLDGGSELSSILDTMTAKGSPSSRLCESFRHAESARVIAWAVVFVVMLLAVATPSWAEPAAPQEQPDSLREVLRDGRPANLFTLTVNNDGVCQTLLETFNRAYSRENVLSPPEAYFSNLLLKSPLSIEWTLARNTGVSSLSIGQADINNDGTADWQAPSTLDTFQRIN